MVISQLSAENTSTKAMRRLPKLIADLCVASELRSLGQPGWSQEGQEWGITTVQAPDNSLSRARLSLVTIHPFFHITPQCRKAFHLTNLSKLQYFKSCLKIISEYSLPTIHIPSLTLINPTLLHTGWFVSVG